MLFVALPACLSDIRLLSQDPERRTSSGGAPAVVSGGSLSNGGSAVEGVSPEGPVGTFHLSFSEECDQPLGEGAIRTSMFEAGSEFRSWGERADWMADEQVAVEGGFCVITAVHEANGDREFTSGVINTSGHFEQSEGVFEARFRAPQGVGPWPVFWLKSQVGWPPAIVIADLGVPEGEIFLGEYWGPLASAQSETEFYPLVERNAFHTYTLDWEGNTFVYYLDGMEIARHERDGGQLTGALYPMINLSVGDGTTRPLPDGSTPFPSRLDLDWIRVYQRER